MVVRDFPDSGGRQLIEPRIADVADERTRAVKNEDRGDARHAVPFRPRAGEAMDFVVGDRESVANPDPNRPRLALEPSPHHPQGNVSRLSAGRLSAYAIDDDEQAARGVNVET